jgi:hypothetical protein
MRLSMASRRAIVSSSVYHFESDVFTMAKITRRMTERELKKHLKPLSVSLWDQARNFYATVGQAISHWSKMEECLIQVAAKLLKTEEPKAGLVMYSIMNLHSWIQIIDDLFVLDGTYPKSLKRWRTVAESLREENNIRVGLAHYSISQDDVDPQGELRAIQAYLRPGKLDIRKKSKTWKPLTMVEIVEFTGRVDKIRDNLISLLKSAELLCRGRNGYCNHNQP